MARTKLASVVSVALQVETVNPYILRVHAEGRANTSGWRSCRLEFARMEYGVAIYDMTAEPLPTGDALSPTPTTMQAVAHYKDDSSVLKAVRVRGASNSLTVPVIRGPECQGGGGLHPFSRL